MSKFFLLREQTIQIQMHIFVPMDVNVDTYAEACVRVCLWQDQVIESEEKMNERQKKIECRR